MGADAGLLRLKLVDGVFGFAAFFVNRKDASCGDGFERVGGFRVNHADVERNEVHGAYDCDGQEQCGQAAIDDLADGNQWDESMQPAQ